MRIALLTTLYPPDIAEPAPYTKELARRLSAHYEVVVVTYGRLPEAVPNVRVITTDKRRPLPWRLVRFSIALWREARTADVWYAHNGASVELPAVLMSLLTRAPLIACMGDSRASERARRNFLYRVIERTFVRRAVAVVHDLPPARPEILPFETYPTQALAQWEEAWRKHCEELTAIFKNAQKS